MTRDQGFIKAKFNEGAVVALVGAGGEAEDHSYEPLFGLFVLVEHVMVEPSAYQWEPGVLVAREGDQDNEEAPIWFVPSHIFHAQVDPHGFGYNEAAQRHEEDMMEMHYERAQREKEGE